MVHVEDGVSVHGYFADTLDKAVGMLQKLDAEMITKKNQPDIAIHEAMNNSFALLKVEDIETAEDVVSHFQGPSKAKDPNGKLTPQVFEPDFSKDDDKFLEMRLRVHCFFEDLHTMQEHIPGIWTQYKERQIDLVTASFIIDSAICLMHEAENELIASWPDCQPYKRYKPTSFNSYKSLSRFFGPEDSFLDDHAPEQLDELASPASLPNELSAHIFTDSYWTCFKFTHSQTAGSLTRKLDTFFPRVQRLPMYCRETPAVFNDEIFQARDKADEAITQIILDALVNLRMVSLMAEDLGHRLSTIDSFTLAISYLSECNVTTNAVFAVTVMKNIHRILAEDSSRPYDDAKALAEKCKRLL